MGGAEFLEKIGMSHLRLLSIDIPVGWVITHHQYWRYRKWWVAAQPCIYDGQQLMLHNSLLRRP